MHITVQEATDLAKAIAWPIIALVALVTLYGPLRNLIETVGRRAVKLSIFKIDFELKEATAQLEATVEGLREVTVSESGLALMTTGIIRSGHADYVLIALGSDDEKSWLTSRLFLLCAILERSRAVKCIVFTGERKKYLGAATPRDVRTELGNRCPEYERALFDAYGTASQIDVREFRNGVLSENIINRVASRFLTNKDIVRFVNADDHIPGWVFLDTASKNTSSTSEFADWVSEKGLIDVMRERYNSGKIAAESGTKASNEVLRQIISQTGTFVALVDSAGKFKGLCDRSIIIDKVSRQAAQQAII